MNIAGFVAILFFITGIVLFIGNVTGCMTSFPLAGFLFMTVGGFIGRAVRD